MPENQPDYYYAPWRIRKLLPLLPMLESGKYSVDEPEPTEKLGNTRRPHWWGAENALNIAADIKNALDSLSSFDRMIVIRAYIQPTLDKVEKHQLDHREDPYSDSHIAIILRCDRDTVKRHRLRAIDDMARHLGWEPKPNAPQRRASPTVWINPRLATQESG